MYQKANSMSNIMNEEKMQDIRIISKTILNRKTIKSNKVAIKEINKVVGKESAEISLRKRKNFRNIWQDYTECSSLHGIKYLGEVPMKISIFGKISWACTLIAGFVCIVLMVQKFWQRYQLIPFNTIIVSFNAPKTSIHFPAVTICPTVPPPKVMRDKIRQEIKIIPPGLTEKDVEFLIKYGSDMSHPYVPPSTDMDSNKMRKLLAANNLTLQEFIPRISRPCNLLFEACWFERKKTDCAEMFQFSHSYKGLCCSFNYILENHLKLKKLSKDFNWDIHRSSLIGVDSGLIVVFKRNLLKSLTTDEKIEHISTNSIGSLVMIHPSTSYPSDEYPVYIVQANRETQLSIYSEKIIRTSEAKVSLLSDYVRCLEYNESLPYFPGYQNTNCYISCRIKASLEICGCIHYYYQPMAIYESKRICDYADIPCLANNRDRIRQAGINDSKLNFNCVCPNSCQAIIFTAKANYIMTEAPQYNPSSVYHVFEKDHAVLRVFWSSQDQKVIHSYPAMDEIQLMASIGGIFSLFLGCSFLSIIEILYFIGLLSRPFMASKKRA